MQEQLQKLKNDFIKGLGEIQTALQLENLEQAFFGRKNGKLTEVMNELKELSGEARKEFGQLVNGLKQELEKLLADKKQEMGDKEMGDILIKEKIDVTQPKLPVKEVGHLHPNTIIQNQLEDLFTSMGFMVLDGPELESDYYNFTAVNIPPDHPARDMQDSFYIKGHSDFVMRTQTSPMQVRGLQKYGAPIRMVVPGRCFRNEATDA